ncbi:MutT/nudix family protein [Xylogone sp. PMI_703]|nr:MutT/nudix family protein [Xylogone sp. PMI_703]
MSKFAKLRVGRYSPVLTSSTKLKPRNLYHYSKMSTATPKVLSTTPLENKDAKWVNLVEIKYESADGKVRRWEAAKRTTKPKSSTVDAVIIVAVLEKSTGPELLLQKQFRPPLNKITIEMPAGLVDENETPEECAVRELKEETGYIGEAISDRTGTRPVLFGAVGLSDSSSFMIHVKVDMDKAENQNPKPQLEDGEFIESFTVPLKDLYNECRKLHSEGFAIDGKVGSVAEGLEMAKLWKV